LILKNGQSFAKEVLIDSNFKLLEIPLNQLKSSDQLLLPRSYPGFQPLYYKSKLKAPFSLSEAEKLEVTFKNGKNDKPISLEVVSVYLK
jgi:hypothetical protein